MVARTEAIKIGDPYDPATMMGAQVSKDQYEKIQDYCNIGIAEGATVLTGGTKNEGVVEGGYYIKPTILKGENNMRVFQEEIFGKCTVPYLTPSPHPKPYHPDPIFNRPCDLYHHL